MDKKTGRPINELVEEGPVIARSVTIELQPKPPIDPNVPLPCPFCNSVHVSPTTRPRGFPNTITYVMCEDCQTGLIRFEIWQQRPREK